MKYNCSKNRDGEPFRFTASFYPNVGVIRDITPIEGNQMGFDRDKVREMMQEGATV